MGQTCQHTIQIPKTLIGRVTRVPSRDVPYESTCQVLCVVAWYRPSYRGQSKTVMFVLRHIMPLRQFPYYCGLGRLNLGKEFMSIMLR